MRNSRLETYFLWRSIKMKMRCKSGVFRAQLVQNIGLVRFLGYSILQFVGKASKFRWLELRRLGEYSMNCSYLINMIVFFATNWGVPYKNSAWISSGTRLGRKVLASSRHHSVTAFTSSSSVSLFLISTTLVEIGPWFFAMYVLMSTVFPSTADLW